MVTKAKPAASLAATAGLTNPQIDRTDARIIPQPQLLPTVRRKKNPLAQINRLLARALARCAYGLDYSREIQAARRLAALVEREEVAA